MSLLGIDYGKKRLGLAIAVKGIIYPYRTLENTNQKLTLKEINPICSNKGIKKIILGMPEGELISEIKKFGKRLSKMVRLPLTEVNEVMTSKEAEKKFGRVKNKDKIDQIAAALILQRYLDKKEVNDV